MAKLVLPEEITLSNGIPVILQPFDGPVAATYWWVSTGSADENPKQAGFAHFLEHMLFKDAAAKETGQASTGQLARMIESHGGDINAYTSFDQTVYHVTCAAQHWERILMAFGVIAKPQSFLKQDFQREREVILEELKKNEDSPGRQLFQSLFSSVFSAHPYGRPVIGFEETLKKATVSQLEQFYKKQYVSENMGLILVGPGLETDRKKAVVRALEKSFGSKVRPRKQIGPRHRAVESPLRKQAEWSLRSFDVQAPSVSFAFRVPELSHEDIPALDLISGILGMGELSRLYQRLFYQTSLVTEVSSGLYAPKDPGMLYIQAELNSTQNIQSVISEILDEIVRLGREGPTQEELNRVLVNAESERLYATQTVDGMAGRLGFLRYVMGDLTFDQHYLEELRAVDSEKIRAVVQRYFVSQRLGGAILVPKKDALLVHIDEIRSLADSKLSAHSQLQLELPSKSRDLPKPKVRVQDEKVQVFEFPSGLKLCHSPKKNSHVFSVHVSMLGGLRLEPVPGLSQLMAMTWAKGTQNRSSRQISAEVEGKAAHLEGYSGRNSAGLQITGLARDWSSLATLLEDVLMQPSFPEDEILHSKRVIEDHIKSIEDHSSQLCSKLFLETLYETHPYGRIMYGDLDTLGKMEVKDLRAIHRSWVSPKRLVVSVSGGVSTQAVEQWISRLETHLLQHQTETASSIENSIKSEEPLRAPRWAERHLKREQLHILIGGLGTQITAEDRHALRLLQTLLGGQSGRLFIELREKKSLAYTVSPVSFEGLEAGYVGTYIACAPSKRPDAIQGIQSVLEKLVKKGISEKELNRAKEFYLGRRAMDLQGDTSLATHYGLETLYQVPHLTEAELIKKVAAIPSKALQKVCEKYLLRPHLVTSIVG